ncbi:MAG: hypothetical protein V3U79_02380 [Dehalococcoidia bacterium]
MPHLITDAIVEAFATAGSYDRIHQLVRKRYGGLATRVIIPIPGCDSRSDEPTVRAINAIE